MESEGVNVTDIRDTIYKDLDEEEQKLFLDVDVNTYQSTEAIKSEIDRL
jgi:hypothetical protein